MTDRLLLLLLLVDFNDFLDFRDRLEPSSLASSPAGLRTLRILLLLSTVLRDATCGFESKAPKEALLTGFRRSRAPKAGALGPNDPVLVFFRPFFMVLGPRSDLVLLTSSSFKSNVP